MTDVTREISSRDFHLLAAGQTLSWLGNGFQTVALATAVVLTGGGPGDLGLVMACSVLAMLAGTLFGGVWADRIQPQWVMVASDLVRFAAVTGIAVMFATGQRKLPLLCALAALTAGAGSFFSPAMTALKPMLVSVARRQSANATLDLLRAAAAVIGPAAGGVSVAAFGASIGFVVNAASFLVSAMTVMFIRARAERGPHRGMLNEMGEGWTEIRHRDWLLSGVIAASVYHVANGVVLVLIQVVAIRELGGAGAVGQIAAAEGLGGVVGAAIALRYRPVRLLRAGWLTLLLMPLWVCLARRPECHHDRRRPWLCRSVVLLRCLGHGHSGPCAPSPARPRRVLGHPDFVHRDAPGQHPRRTAGAQVRQG